MISYGADKSPRFAYNISVEDGQRSELIDWGNSPQWIEKMKDKLDGATRISFIPKPEVQGYAPVSVGLGDGKRWIIFSRVFGRMDTLRKIRVYAIGWQSTVGGVNVKSILWIYPGGAVENAEHPDEAIVRGILLSS